MPSGTYRESSMCGVEGCFKPHGSHGFCAMHSYRWKKYGDPLKVSDKYAALTAPDDALAGFRTCLKCKEIKAESSEFFRFQKGKDGLARTCRLCDMLLNKEWAIANPENKAQLDRIGQIRRSYGYVGLALHNRKLKGDGCDICGQSLSLKCMGVDHDHTSGQVRGLLCSNCNTAIGLVKENEETLLGIIDYLRKYKSVTNVEYAEKEKTARIQILGEDSLAINLTFQDLKSIWESMFEEVMLDDSVSL